MALVTLPLTPIQPPARSNTSRNPNGRNLISRRRDRTRPGFTEEERHASLGDLSAVGLSPVNASWLLSADLLGRPRETDAAADFYVGEPTPPARRLGTNLVPRSAGSHEPLPYSRWDHLGARIGPTHFMAFAAAKFKVTPDLTSKRLTLIRLERSI